MSEHTDLIDRYIASWNERDDARRRDLIAKTWTMTASYIDPVLQGEGRDGIDAAIQVAQAKFPGHRFRRTGPIEVHHDRARFTWELAPADGAAVVSGTDFAVLSPDRRLHSVTGFFDSVPPTA
ncbi:MAG TPA: hypothetical protein VMB81_17400 [Candidatus Sulfotelmatobacter sp.]|nr:hypothetical protein [Candidatus Sulfotelmatobacter sp.]